MSRSTGRVRRWGASASFLVLAAVVCAAAMPRSIDASPARLAAAGTASGDRANALSDSVLAVVGPNRKITVTDLRQAWTRVSPPARPDSLTPQGAREFLDLMIAKEALGEIALRETWQWTAQESARVNGLRDRLMMALVLDSALRVTQAEHVAEGGDSLPGDELGTLARDRAMARMQITYDEALLARLAEAWAAIPAPPRDSGIFAALRGMGRDPEIPASDMDAVVARAPQQTIQVRELFEYWKRLNPLARPRITSAPQIGELVANAVYENLLRQRAQAQGYDRHPDIVRAVNREIELIAVTHLVQREVHGKIPTDTASLAAYYRQKPEAWNLPPRVRVLRLVLPDRAQAEAMLPRLANAAEVESLAAQAKRAGLSYEAEYSADIDRAIFEAGTRLGEGGIMGPDSTEQGWAVTRVLRVLPVTPRPLAQVRELVQHAMFREEGERRMQELLSSVRKQVPHRVNEAALKRVSAGS